MTYSEKLKDPRWQKKRLEILERDGWKCINCLSNDETLFVHHLKYENGNPWEISKDYLMTLCESCHLQEKEYRLEFEDLLLDTLKKSGFSADHVFLLASVFNSMNENIKEKTNSRILGHVSNVLESSSFVREKLVEYSITDYGRRVKRRSK